MRFESDAADDREDTGIDADSDREDQDDDRGEPRTAADETKRVTYVFEHAFGHRGGRAALTAELLDPGLRHEPAGPPPRGQRTGPLGSGPDRAFHRPPR